MIQNPNPIAATYEAAVHCIGCAEKRFGSRLYDRSPPLDREGEEVHLVFTYDAGAIEADDTCGTCHGEL